jgi:hypothetical protein
MVKSLQGLQRKSVPVPDAQFDARRQWSCAACRARDVIPGVCLFLESCSGHKPSGTAVNAATSSEDPASEEQT